MVAASTHRGHLAVALLAVCLTSCIATAAQAQVMALTGTAPLAGNQGFAGPLGFDFVVNLPIEITGLGVFDSGQDGIVGASQLDVAIWERDDNGTNSEFGDDSGVQILAQLGFNAVDQGTLSNVFRVKNLTTPIMLQPGSYTLSAGGFDDDNPLSNSGSGGPTPTINDSGAAIQFVGTSRFQSPPDAITTFPSTPDGGPATRYFTATMLYNPPPFDAFASVVIDRETGEIVMRNGTAAALDIIGYTISSGLGALDSDNWTPIAGNHDVNGTPPLFDPDDAWTRLTAAGGLDDLSEFQFGGDGGTLGAGQDLDLGGAIWIANTSEDDIQFEYVLQDNTRQQGLVRFVGNGGSPFPFGDLNFDGSAFQLDDFTDVMLPQLESSHSSLSLAQSYQVGDLDGDLDVDVDDFRLFKSNYVAGGGSLVALNNAILGVPEPSSLWLCCLGLVGMFLTKWAASRNFRRLAVFMALACLAATTNSASAQIVALQSIPPLTGNQNFGGELGMDFNVIEFPVEVSALGFFDSDQDGLVSANIWVEIWSRDDGGTPTDPTDDTGINVVGGLSTTFAPGTDGTPSGGSRFKSVTPVSLNPGSYTIVAGGFGDDDPLLNTGIDGPTSTINGSGGILQFVGDSRFGVESMPGNFPNVVDAGPANRYHTGTFQYSVDIDPMVLEINTLTGAATIRNTGATTFDVDYYRISSDAGSLNPTGWSSLEDQSMAGWNEGGAATDSALVEANLTGSMTFTPGTTVPLGQPYDHMEDEQDVVFTYYTLSGVAVDGPVQYVELLAGDYDHSGTVNSLDYDLWASTFGSTSNLAADGNNNGIVDAADYSVWRDNFGAMTPGSANASGVVPEPGFGAMLSAVVAVLVLRRIPRLNRLIADWANTPRQSMLGIVACFGLLFTSTAFAAVTNDRDYQMGDEPDEDASASIEVGTGAGSTFPGHTFDSAGNGGGDFQDLEAFGSTGGLPRYVSTSSRPGAGGSELGIRFDGVDDYLRAFRFGLPSTTESAFSGVDGLAPLDYSGLSNRGFQLWVNPDRDDVLQSVVMDTNQHGLQITADGTWSMRYSGVDYDSGEAVTTGAWTHVIVVRPFGGALGAWMYVDGVVVAAAPGGYDGGDDTPLIVGANTDSELNAGDAGTSEFFDGVLDNLEMFVLGTSIDTSTNYGTFNPGTDNPIIAAALAGFDDGDVNLDGDVNNSDISDFVTHWKSERLVNGLRVGDLTGRENGDLNFDGIVDLGDAIILNQALLANGLGALDFSKLGGDSVPEPSTWMLLVATAIFLAGRFRFVR